MEDLHPHALQTTAAIFTNELSWHSQPRPQAKCSPQPMGHRLIDGPWTTKTSFLTLLCTFLEVTRFLEGLGFSYLRLHYFHTRAGLSESLKPSICSAVAWNKYSQTPSFLPPKQPCPVMGQNTDQQVSPNVDMLNCSIPQLMTHSEPHQNSRLNKVHE